MKGLVDRNKQLKTEGTSQRTRHLAPLQPDYFRIDERTREDLVAFATRYAQNISYFTADNKPDGDWSAFFEKDITIEMIRISGFDLDVLKDRAERILTTLNPMDDLARQQMAVVQSKEAILELFYQIERWKLSTRSLTDFNKEHCKLIEDKFSPLLFKLRAYLWLGQALNLLDETHQVRLDELGKEWEVAAFEAELEEEGQRMLELHAAENFDPIAARGIEIMSDLWRLYRKGKEPNEKIYRSMRYYKDLFLETLTNIELVKESARNYLNEKLLVNGNAKPHVALFLAFADIYKHAQDDLNGFTLRHLEHYYRKVLHMKERSFAPDTLHLIFVPGAGVEQLLIPKGTELKAGQDSAGNEITYVTDKELVMNQTSIADVKAIVQDEITPDDHLFKFMELTPDVYHINKSVPAENAAPSAKDRRQLVELGFAVADSIFNVDEGDRLIKFRFHFELLSFRAFETNIRTHISEHPLSGMFGSELKELNTLLKDFFLLQYTTEDSWYDVPKEKVELNLIQDEFGVFVNQAELLVLLKPTDPTVDACANDEFLEAVEAELPVFKFAVNPNKMYVFDIFNDLIVDRVEINVDVLGVRNLRLQSDYGMLDSNSPIEPFGQLPTVGSTFYIGHESLFDHQLTDLRININWFNVPDLKNGLVEYYKHYPNVESNQSFKVAVSLLREKRWWPTENRQIIPLFQDVDERVASGIEIERKVQTNSKQQRAVSPVRRINELDLSLLGTQHAPNAVKKQDNTLMLTNDTLGGYLSLELVNPSTAFGHKLYPELMTKIVSEGVLKKKPLEEVPNEPFTPTIKQITLDYSATSTIDFRINENRNQLVYALHPFGNVTLNHLFGDEPIKILPSYEKGSYIHIGIENFKAPMLLSMLFQINETGLDEFTQLPVLEWHYLHEDRWIPITEGQIPYNTTYGMTRSGLVAFSFGEHVQGSSTMLDNELFWIRCYCDIGSDFIDNIADIRTNAISASFLNRGNDLSHLSTFLPANTIEGTREEIGQIGAVLQPYVSFGGRAPEEKRMFFNRVSERLRHKDRAINIWDYENLVLEEFPSVCRVRCLSHMNGEMQLSPGDVLVVVVPFFFGNEDDKFQRPKLAVGQLHEIRDFLQQRVSSFVEVHVKNPVYEEIQLSLDVKFREGRDPGFYINQLNEDLKLLLSSWYYIYEEQVNFGEVIHPSTILKYVEDREYIDYVTNFSIYHLVNGEVINLHTANSSEIEIEPSSERSVLISAPNHSIGLVDDFYEGTEGVGDMVVGTSFTVHEEIYLGREGGGIAEMIVGSDFTVYDEPDPEGDFEPITLRIKSN